MGAGGPMPGCPCGCGERRPAAAARRPEEHIKELLRTLLQVTRGDKGMLLHPVGSRTPAMQARARRQARARLHGQLALHGGRLLAQPRQLGLQRAGLVGRGLQLAAQTRHLRFAPRKVLRGRARLALPRPAAAAPQNAAAHAYGRGGPANSCPTTAAAAACPPRAEPTSTATCQHFKSAAQCCGAVTLLA